MTVPQQKPGRSKQDYGTPPALIAALERAFGKFDWDLAATAENKVASRWLGPGSPDGVDALSCAWPATQNIRLWLNPPFSHIEPWAAHALEWSRVAAPYGCRLFMLTPASVGSNWFANYVFGRARVFFLKPRLTFVGEKDPYVKDCMLSVFGLPPGFEMLDWKAPVSG